MASSAEKLEIVKNCVAAYKDFPKPGILFRDVFSVLKNPHAFKCLLDLLIEHIENLNTSFDAVVGLDSRGFLFGPFLALHFQVPFVPVRKKGKLPGEIISLDYILEYGKDCLEIQRDSVKSGATVIIVDDLLATGGSMSATCKLLQKLEVNVLECVTVLELIDLNGKDKINAPFFSLIQY